ncbi:MAG: electron transfer flavoprotein subunit alpha [Clostridia bacterium]|nr:electron transfer flavoprotein subunit alpha [Clostridia bacterium]
MAAYICNDLNKCVGCGLCMGSCANNAIRIEDGKAVIDQNACVLCKVCIEACPVGALSLVTEGASNEADTAAYRGVWVFAEVTDGIPEPVGYELTAKAHELAEKRGDCPVTVLLFGKDAETYRTSFIEAGADHVLCSDAPVFHDKLDLPYADTLCRLIEERRPEALLFGATPFGRSLAPRVAARMGCGLTADCTVLDIDPENGLLLQTRPAFGGNLMATITCPTRRPQMATVRPGIFQAPTAPVHTEGSCEALPFVPEKGVVELLEQLVVEAGESIRDARIILSAGRGIGSQKNLKLLKALAEKLGAAYGVSRPLVDLGWADYSHQIGQTGVSVAPDLLICFGISGAIQHLAGIGGAKTIVAVNTDPEAPIFSAAHYKIVDDAASVIKAMLDTL